MSIPANSSVVIPRLVCRNPAAAVDFCVAVFGATSLGGRPGADGTLAHALLTIGGEMLMIEAEWPGFLGPAPTGDGHSPVVIFVYVDDVDGTVERAVAQGARVVMPAQNQFWGDRTALIVDPAGHVWTVATRIEETTEEQRQDRWSGILKERNA
jgi:PhnB protein